jgi:hypothetical protein
MLAGPHSIHKSCQANSFEKEKSKAYEKKFFIGIFLTIIRAACAPASTEQEAEPFETGAMPDQDPELLQRRFGLLAAHLSEELGIPVKYRLQKGSSSWKIS